MVVMKIGSPPKTFNLLVDSGSSDLWVGAEGCQGDDGGSCVILEFSLRLLLSLTDEKFHVYLLNRENIIS